MLSLRKGKLMKTILCILTACVILISCGKRTVPNETVQVYNTTGPLPAKKADSVEVKKPVAATKPKPVVPKVIMVSDNYAKKTIDGRLYYDARGHRYWKNFKDGKYYLYNKSMYSNEDFRPPKN